MTIIITAVSSSFRHQKGPWPMPQAWKGPHTKPLSIHNIYGHYSTLWHLYASLAISLKAQIKKERENHVVLFTFPHL